jgi:hypothetical protein
MKSILKQISKGLLLVPALLLGLSVAAPATVVNAAATCDNTDLTIGGGANCAAGTQQASGPGLFDPGGIFQTVSNILLFLVGAISVIMLIIGGIRYVISGGDQNQVTSAKNTILYAIVGIVIAFLAYAAVNFVTTQLQNAAG